MRISLVLGLGIATVFTKRHRPQRCPPVRDSQKISSIRYSKTVINDTVAEEEVRKAEEAQKNTLYPTTKM